MNSCLMFKEASQTPAVIAQQFELNQAVVSALAAKFQQRAPKHVMIIGRGSSDHAGVFGKYLIEVELGIPVSSAAPSVTSVYGKSLKLADSVVLVLSQSGRSPDILAQAEMAKAAGAYCIALVNDQSSPLAELADAVLPLHAGVEASVAATKSYLATLSALLHLVAYWSENQSLIKALDTLPALLKQQIDSASQFSPDDLINEQKLVVLARGFGFAIAKEIALKLKEVCSIQAESFSSAEFLHGPVTLVSQGLTILNAEVADEALTAHQAQIKEVVNRGAKVFTLTSGQSTCHPRLAPLALLQRFYLDVAALAVAKGLNPDQPAGLNKVTRTL